MRNPFKSATKNLLDEAAEYQLYEKAANDLEANILDKGIWTKAYTRAKGDESVQKALYIEMIVEHYKKLILAGEEVESILKSEIARYEKSVKSTPKVIEEPSQGSWDLGLALIAIFFILFLILALILGN